MPTIEEVINKLKGSDEEAAGVVSKLLDAHDNFKTQSRRWEDQAKANKDDAEAYRNGKSNAEDLQKQLDEQIEKVGQLEKQVQEKDSQITEYQQKEDRSELLSEVAGEKGIPAQLYSYPKGNTKEELEASAHKLKRDFKYGEVDGFGNAQKLPSKDTIEDGKALYEDYQEN